MYMCLSVCAIGSPAKRELAKGSCKEKVDLIKRGPNKFAIRLIGASLDLFPADGSAIAVGKKHFIAKGSRMLFQCSLPLMANAN